MARLRPEGAAARRLVCGEARRTAVLQGQRRTRLRPVFSFLARRLVFIALAVVCIPLAAWTVSGGPLETMREALPSPRADQPQPSRGGGPGAAENEPRL